MSKLILTDADGVLFDWVSGFTTWMSHKGHIVDASKTHLYSINKWYNMDREQIFDLITEYNGHPDIASLPAWKDSIEYVKKLHDNHGYRFVVITSMGDHPHSHKWRLQNLKELFGDSFDELIINGLAECKKSILEKYQPAIWIEDKPSNAESGLLAGHRTFLMEHEHNANQETSIGITRVQTWEEIYNCVVAEEQGTIEMKIPV